MGSFRRQRTFPVNDELDNTLRSFPELEDGNVGMYSITALQIAAAFTAAGVTPTIVHLLKFNTVNQADAIGRTPLHYAAINGNAELAQLLLDSGADSESKFQHKLSILKTSGSDYAKWNKLYSTLPIPDSWGRTALHEAAKEGRVNVVRLLIERGANVNAQDDKGVTPLLLTGCSKNQDDYEQTVELLVRNGAAVDVKNNVTGSTALFHAVALQSIKATKTLLEAGAWISVGPCQQTELHEAAANGLFDILEMLLENPKIVPGDLNRPDGCNRTPMCRAACGGHRECLKLLIDKGGDLGYISKTRQTVMDYIFARISKPAQFIRDLLDEQITGCKRNGMNYSVILDFKVLTPYGNDHQMQVITNMLNAASEREKIEVLQHPLIEAFLRLKWEKIRLFFFLLIFAYVVFVLSLSSYVMLLIHQPENFRIVGNVVRVFVIVTSAGLSGHALIQCILVPRHFFTKYEIWMNLICTLLSLIVTGMSPINDSNVNNLPHWILHATSIAVLLAWAELMLLIGRFPTYGYYALMFSSVLQNVVKVLMTFICLVIGFALSFAIQFHNYEQFKHPWRALVKTTVMMMGEFEYADLFTDDAKVPRRLPTTSRVIFLLFIVLASIVLMNLMVGLAVSDIQGLQQEGNAKRLEKQAEFLRQLEKVISFKGIDSRWFPACVRNILKRKRCIGTRLVIQPEHAGSLCVESKKAKKFPAELLEAIVQISTKKTNGDDLFSDENLPRLIDMFRTIVRIYEKNKTS